MAAKPEVIVTERELPKNVIRALEQGRKIEAIKLLREATGLGLANAKVLVDRAASRLQPRDTSPSMVEDNGSLGKFIGSLLLLTFLYAFYRYFVAG